MSNLTDKQIMLGLAQQLAVAAQRSAMLESLALGLLSHLSTIDKPASAALAHRVRAQLTAGMRERMDSEVLAAQIAGLELLNAIDAAAGLRPASGGDGG